MSSPHDRIRASIQRIRSAVTLTVSDGDLLPGHLWEALDDGLHDIANAATILEFDAMPKTTQVEVNAFREFLCTEHLDELVRRVANEPLTLRVVDTGCASACSRCEGKS